MESKNKVLEALQMQPLSEAEKASRHILARLYGPIATTKEKTRNGRGYNAELWRRALADDIFREKVANKSLFLELGHPLDREETDMEKVCACIPELPKIVDGDLYAYVDILDTKNGRLLKTLCDYGFVPGISSRGSGDIMENDEVDPETFFLETWDIVQLPAVKKARLTMCESLKTNKNLKTALKESFDKMNAEDRAEAEKTLERLELNLDAESQKESLDEEPYPDIPWAPGEASLIEETEAVEPKLAQGETTEVEKPAVTEPETEQSKQVDAKAEPEQDKQKDAKLVEADDEAEETEEVEETDPVEDDASEEIFTVGTLVDSLNEYDEETALEFAPIVVDGVEFKITELVLDDEEEGKVIVNVVYDSPEKEDDKDIEDEEVESDVEESSPEDADQPEAEDASEEATDDGDDEVIESLKEMVRQKDALEEEVLDLKNQQVVSDAKMSELQEELTKYKTGFVRVSELASKATKLQKEVTQLQEQLGTKETTIKNLESKISTQTKLTESVSRSTNQVKDLQERLRRVVGEAESTEQELKEQVESTRATASKNAQIAKAYKQKYLEAVEHYIASKATMLGVTSRDIKAKLHEGYTLADVDAVCDTLLNAGRPAFGLGIATQAGTKVKLKESASVKNTTLYGSDSDLADLLEFAGLK
jgi:hypothetical protein